MIITTGIARVIIIYESCFSPVTEKRRKYELQVLAFLPEECSCNGGKMTPDACMAYAEQWLAKHYPHQQVILALHEESDKDGKRFAVHMAINRTDLLTGKRLWEGTGAQAKHKRASWVREMDEAWNLTQLEKGKKNSKIRDRQPRDIEKEIVDRGEYSYKNNLRELIHIAISDYHPKNMEQFKKLLASWGVDIFIKNNRVYATDLDIKEAGNPKCTFNLTRLDGRFALKSLQTAFETGTTESEKPMTFEQRRDVYIQRLKKAYSAWVMLLGELFVALQSIIQIRFRSRAGGYDFVCMLGNIHGKKIKVDTGPVIERIDNLFTNKLFTGAKTFALFLGDLRLLPFFLFLQGGDLAIDVFDTLWHGTFLSFGYYSSPSSF